MTEKDIDDYDDGDHEIFSDLSSSSSGNGEEQKEMWDEILWRAKKIELEEANRRSFLKSRPRKLPYEECRKWVRANLDPDTKEEFFDLVANGNVRTPYIPKQPEKFYSEQGTWISWEHFLNESIEPIQNDNDSDTNDT